jgi:hypothetical protein
VATFKLVNAPIGVNKWTVSTSPKVDINQPISISIPFDVSYQDVYVDVYWPGYVTGSGIILAFVGGQVCTYEGKAYLNFGEKKIPYNDNASYIIDYQNDTISQTSTIPLPNPTPTPTPTPTPAGFSLSQILPMPPNEGPPLPQIMKIYWPWYKGV